MLADIVNRIRAEHGLTNEVPDFDPSNGKEQAIAFECYLKSGSGREFSRRHF